MSVVFADTFYFIGLMNRLDRTHDDCVRFARQHRGRFITTAWVLVEVADAWAASPHRIQAGRLFQELARHPQFQIIRPNQSLLDRAVALYLSRQDKEWSLTDCLSFRVMEDQGITAALTGDHHFEQAGFSVLLK